MRNCFTALLQQLKRLRTQVFLAYFLVLSLSALVLGVGVAMIARQALVDQIGASRLDLLRQISERANTVKTSATTLSGLYQYELTALQTSELAQNNVEAYLATLNEKYNDVFKPIGMDHDLIVYSPDYTYSSLPEGKLPLYMEDQLWYRRLRQNLLNVQPGTVSFSSTFRSADDSYQFAAARLVVQGEHTCMLLVLMDESILEHLYTPAKEVASDIYIYDQDGRIVSHSNKKMLGKQFIDTKQMAQLYGTNQFSMIKKLGKDYLLTTYLDETTGWTIVEEVPVENLFGVLVRMYGLIFMILGVCLLVSLLIALYQSRWISRPLTHLSDAMDNFGGKNFTPLSTSTGTLEIDCLRQSFNHMAGEIVHLMDTITEQERQKRVAEMNFLRAQINPHFLYNMLFSIRCTVEMGKSTQAVQMIEAFTDLLKTTLKTTGDTIPLTQEFESTKKYLVVQKLRYGEKVHFEMDLGRGTENCMVPPLLLQPLVENAIFHGLEARDGADMIVVASALEGQDLLLTVTDNGAGMARDVLEKVYADILAQQDGREKQSDSIGLANVHNRIRLNYGEGYGVHIDSVPDIGSTVTLRLPVRIDPKIPTGQEGAL